MLVSCKILQRHNLHSSFYQYFLHVKQAVVNFDSLPNTIFHQGQGIPQHLLQDGFQGLAQFLYFLILVSQKRGS